MNTLDIEHQTNGTFTQTFALDAWSDLYDLSDGHWHSMLRTDVESAIAHYEWSTENGGIEYSQTLAHGEITFTINPTPDSNITIGTTVVIFGTDVVIGLNLAATMTSLRTFLDASDDENISRCTYSVTPITSGSVLNMVYKTAGTLGNAFPFATTVPGSTPSNEDELFEGGGSMLTMVAQVEDIAVFVGDYFYDVRFQGNNGILVPVIGGMITFTQGVTRDTQDEI